MKLHRNVWATSVASFLTDVSSEMIWNVLPLFLSNVLGARMTVVGLIEGAGESLSSLLKVFSGFLSDRYSNRKKLAVSGYGLSTVAKPLLYFATTWGTVLAVRVTDRIGKGIRTAPRDALLASSVPTDQRGFAFGLHRAADTAGAFVGLVAAGAVVWLTQRGGLELERATFQTLVFWGAIPAAIAVLVLALAAKEVGTSRPTSRPRLTLEGFDPEFRRFLLAEAVFTLGNSADAFLVLRAQERGLSVLGILAMLAGFNLVYALLSVPAGRWSDRLGRRRVIVVGWLSYAVIYLGFALAEGVEHIVPLYVAYGCYHGLTDGVARAYVADVSAEDKRGTAFGLFHAAIGAVALPSSLLAGLLWQNIGPSAPFWIGATLALLATFLLLAPFSRLTTARRL
ncbi:MAG TPA: MFS transporter [Vicinamibacteria bacterium]|nr:MFS transporter [Vicinamibacteria bacterium]